MRMLSTCILLSRMNVKTFPCNNYSLNVRNIVQSIIAPKFWYNYTYDQISCENYSNNEEVKSKLLSVSKLKREILIPLPAPGGKITHNGVFSNNICMENLWTCNTVLDYWLNWGANVIMHSLLNIISPHCNTLLAWRPTRWVLVLCMNERRWFGLVRRSLWHKTSSSTTFITALLNHYLFLIYQLLLMK